MSKISNAITMLQLLSSGRKYSIEELSRELEVSPRMIRVYKSELEAAGYYIESIMGPYGGYVLSNNNVKLPLRKYNYDDVKTLEYYIEKEHDDSRLERLKNLQDKINGIYIENREIEKEHELKGELLKTYNILVRAIKEKRRVKITYKSIPKGEIERVIEPGEMLLFQSGWWCVAFCLLRHDIRHFDLKRITKIELLKENF